eukprot:s634_g1.t1
MFTINPSATSMLQKPSYLSGDHLPRPDDATELASHPDWWEEICVIVSVQIQTLAVMIAIIIVVTIVIIVATLVCITVTIITIIKAFAASLRVACEQSGFLYLVDHGLDAKLETAQRALKRFFDQPTEVKSKIGTSASRVFPAHSRGWVANETLDPSQQGKLDLKESLEVGLERPEEVDPKVRPFRGPNNWPSEVPELEQDFMTAVRALHDLSMDILGALEDGLDVEPGTLSNLCDDPMVLCRGLHYYTPCGTEVDPMSLGCSAHTDYGLISLLHQTGPGSFSRDVILI